jgi:hypothetical protein
VPNGGLLGQYLRKVSNLDQDLEWGTLPAASGLPIVTVGGSTYTFAATDVGGYVRFTGVGSVTITVPTNAAVPIAVGSEITFMATQATSVFISTSGITVLVPSGFTLEPFSPGAVITIKKIGTNTWDAFGLLKPT